MSPFRWNVVVAFELRGHPVSSYANQLQLLQSLRLGSRTKDKDTDTDKDKE